MKPMTWFRFCLHQNDESSSAFLDGKMVLEKREVIFVEHGAFLTLGGYLYEPQNQRLQGKIRAITISDTVSDSYISEQQSCSSNGNLTDLMAKIVLWDPEIRFQFISQCTQDVDAINKWKFKKLIFTGSSSYVSYNISKVKSICLKLTLDSKDELTIFQLQGKRNELTITLSSAELKVLWNGHLMTSTIVASQKFSVNSIDLKTPQLICISFAQNFTAPFLGFTPFLVFIDGILRQQACASAQDITMENGGRCYLPEKDQFRYWQDILDDSYLMTVGPRDALGRDHLIVPQNVMHVFEFFAFETWLDALSVQQLTNCSDSCSKSFIHSLLPIASLEALFTKAHWQGFVHGEEREPQFSVNRGFFDAVTMIANGSRPSCLTLEFLKTRNASIILNNVFR